MKILNWLAIPFAAMMCVTVGCGPSTDTTVIEAEPMTEEEIYDADAAYDQQYQEAAENYE